MVCYRSQQKCASGKGVKEGLIHHSTRMQRQFVSGAGPGSANTPAATYSLLELATSRVGRGEATFRSGEFSCLQLTPGEWAPVEAAVRSEVARHLREKEGAGRPPGSLKSCLKGAPTPKTGRAVTFSDDVETRTATSTRGLKHLRFPDFTRFGFRACSRRCAMRDFIDLCFCRPISQIA